MSTPSPSEGGGIDLDAPTPLTWLVTATLVAVHAISGGFAWSWGVGPWSAWVGARSLRVRSLLGGQTWDAVNDGAVWRLATSVLLHADLLHLLTNAVGLWVLGRIAEPWVGAPRLAMWFVVGGLGGSAASQLAGVPVSDGASGAAFCWMAALWMLAFRRRASLPAQDQRLLGPGLGTLIVANVALSIVVPGVDVVAHLGGLGAGLALGALPMRGSGWVTALLGVCGFVATVAYGWSVG